MLAEPSPARLDAQLAMSRMLRQHSGRKETCDFRNQAEELPSSLYGC